MISYARTTVLGPSEMGIHSFTVSRLLAAAALLLDDARKGAGGWTEVQVEGRGRNRVGFIEPLVSDIDDDELDQVVLAHIYNRTL